MEALTQEEEKMALSIFEPDILAKQFTVREGSKDCEGEKALMLAVLEDAVACFQKYAFSEDEKGRKEFEAAETWIEGENRNWPFSFHNICEVLGLDPGYIRKGLSHWRDGHAELRTKHRVRYNASGRRRIS